MLSTQQQHRFTAPETRPLSHAEILANPGFFGIEVRIARHLVGIHEKSPRLARLKASHQKWFMTQMLFALQLERDAVGQHLGLTPTRLHDSIARYNIASRNTAASFLAEILAYKFIREVPHPRDKRIHMYETTEIATQAMMSWFDGHMACLDEMDGGNRHALSLADRRIFRLAQPRAAHALLEDVRWRILPESIAPFIRSESGGMVLHEVVSRMSPDGTDGDRAYAGEVSIALLAGKYAISVTNVKRMFAPAQASGDAGWEKPRRKGQLWFSRRFVNDYFHWQATKFAALDEAAHWARETLGPMPLDAEACSSAS